MKEYLLIIREPDGRTEPVSPEFMERHQQHWKAWISALKEQDQFVSGTPLTLNGAQITANGTVLHSIHKNGTEIIGGFMLIKAADMEAAIAIARTCPALEANALVELREVM